jgi:endoglucanase
MSQEEKKISKEESRQFLVQYMNAYSPVGQEMEGQKIWLNYIKQYVEELHQDSYGTVYGVIRSKEQDGKKDSQRYKVVIEAHCDEIAWQVTYIEANGIIHVAKAGGSDAAIAPSKKVIIHTKDGRQVPGVFGFPAIHVRKTVEEKAPKPENLTIDVGYNTKSSVIEKLGIEVGDLVTFDEQFSILGWHYTGKSLDNKIGGYIISQVAKKLKENKIELPFDLYIVNAVQEEVGLLGAKNIAQRLKADVALVHDVCHATDGVPGMSKVKNCDITTGGGPTLEYASQNHKGLLKFIREVADKEKISYQIEIGSQGNDTMGFFLANTVTAIIASPLKYMHTTCEMVHKKDVTLAIELFYHCLVNMKPIKWVYHDLS